MADFAMNGLGGSWLTGIVWQSGVLLLLGLGASAALRRWPARAHRALLLAMAGAIVAPLGSQVARIQGWGLWAAGPADRPEISGSPTTATASSVVRSSPGFRPAGPRPERRAETLTGPTPGPAPEAIAPTPEGIPTVPERPAIPAGESISTGSVLLGLWGLLSGLCLARLAAATIAGRRFISRAQPVADEGMARAARIAATRLALRADPLLRVSSRAACPAIWCWGRRPVIVVPESAIPTSTVDWAGVFCHELAHWMRKDHWSGLFAEVLVCLLPWNPLAWWARHRLGQLSELACDDWALSTGLEAADYAEALLSLVPQRRTAPALSAVSSHRGLVGRVRHILDERPIVPAVGRRWTFAGGTIVALAASAIALAQARPAASKDEKPKDGPPALSQVPSKPATSVEKPAAKRRVVRGMVLEPGGQPAAGAHVVWRGQRKAQLPISAMPRGQRANPRPYGETLAETRTDAAGRFEIAADFDPDQYEHEDGFAAYLVIAFPGAGLLVPRIRDDTTEVTLRLPPQVMIHGRLLTPSGAPAAGVRVALETIFDYETMQMEADARLPDDLIPSYWPRPRTTGADGRFTFEGVPEGMFAQIKLQHPDYAIDEVTVNAVTRGGINKTLSEWLKGVQTVPVKPDFTYTLEPSRPVQGRVTDKATGKPLAGVVIEMITMGRHGGRPFYTHTDADGRYRVSGHQGDSYSARAYPDPESGYLPAEHRSATWPAGARYLEKNFALSRGRVVHGRVIDADTKRPIAGAAVVYQPRRDHPDNDRGYNFDHPVVTDAEGRFAITTLPGAGIVAVETTDENYMRVAVKDDGTFGRAFPQGVASIDVPNDGEPPSAEILVRKGVLLQVRVLDPDGKPAQGTIATCEGIDARLMDVWNFGQPAVDGVFRMQGADPSRTYRLFFIHPERKLGAVLDAKPGPEGGKPVEVRLRPTAKFHGKVVTSSGSPAQGGEAYPALFPEAQTGKMSREELLMNLERFSYFNLLGQQAMMSYTSQFPTNPRGEFAIDTLIPGIDLHVMVYARQGWALVPVPPLKPGEDRDLGTIKLEEMKD
jgi:beta-lactamase regulating signal transducer with metallopeptidase domain